MPRARAFTTYLHRRSPLVALLVAALTASCSRATWEGIREALAGFPQDSTNAGTDESNVQSAVDASRATLLNSTFVITPPQPYSGRSVEQELRVDPTFTLLAVVHYSDQAAPNVIDIFLHPGSQHVVRLVAGFPLRVVRGAEYLVVDGLSYTASVQVLETNVARYNGGRGSEPAIYRVGLRIVIR